MNEFENSENFNSEELSEGGIEENSEVVSEDSSEDLSEDLSEDISEIIIQSEVQIPEETLTQISELHTVGIMGLAMFGTMFFIWVFDFIFKKLSHYF